MSDRDLFDAVARKTGESNPEIARRGFDLTGLDRPPAQDPRHPGGLGRVQGWPRGTGREMTGEF
ncbi:MAG: hypothetical protein NT171_16705 [Planctomycetota bacterium]|nr:hypothetical protein [Planctomycetota bacterium]